MNIEFLDIASKKIISSLEQPEGYSIPLENAIIETFDLQEDKELYQERRRVHLDGVNINFYKRSLFQERKTWVRSDSSYVQMHFEVYGSSCFYYHQNKKFTIATRPGQCNLFYVPALDGMLVDPPCKDAFTLDIELSEEWIKKNIGTSPTSALNFLEDMNSERPTLLSGRSNIISPQMLININELYNCSYTGNIKRLYMEAKLMELLAHQLQQSEDTKDGKTHNKLSKIEIDNLYFIKEKITTNLSKNYSIEDLSYLSFMNRTKLQSAFKELFGCTIHDCVIDSRMNLAYQLLTESYSNNWNISQIAHQVGYQHSNHFSAAFKRKFGVSPSVFLKK